MRVTDAEIAFFRVIYKHRLRVAVIIFVQLAPCKSVFAVAEENFLIAAGGVKVCPQVACRIICIQIFRHGLHGYGKVLCCFLTVQRKLCSQFHLNRILSCRRTGYFTAVVKAVFVHRLVCNNVCIVGCPVDVCTVLSFFYQGQVASYIICILDCQSVCRLLKERI